MGYHLGEDEKLITKLKSMRPGDELEITREQARVLAGRLMSLPYPHCLVGDDLIENEKCELIGRQIVVTDDPKPPPGFYKDKVTAEHACHRYMQFPNICRECSEEETERNHPRN